MSLIPNARSRCAAIAVLCVSCDGSSPTQPPAGPSPSPTPAAQPSPAASASPEASACPKGSFAPGPVTRLAIQPRAQQSNGVSAPMRTRLVGPGEEVLCLDSDKSHRLDFNLNQRNAQGQESCWEGFPSYRIRGDTERMVTGTSPIDDNGFVFRVRVEPNKNVASFGVEAELDGVFSHPWTSGGGYPREPLRVITLPGDEIEGVCPCIYIGNGGYAPGSCQR